MVCVSRLGGEPLHRYITAYSCGKSRRNMVIVNNLTCLSRGSLHIGEESCAR